MKNKIEHIKDKDFKREYEYALYGYNKRLNFGNNVIAYPRQIKRYLLLGCNELHFTKQCRRTYIENLAMRGFGANQYTIWSYCILHIKNKI